MYTCGCINFVTHKNRKGNSSYKDVFNAEFYQCFKIKRTATISFELTSNCSNKITSFDKDNIL